MDASIEQGRAWRRFEKDYAAGYLRNRGMAVIAVDWKSGDAAADVVALDGDTLVIVSSRIYEGLTDFPEWHPTDAERNSRENARAAFVKERPELAACEYRFDRIEVLKQGCMGVRMHHIDAFDLVQE